MKTSVITVDPLLPEKDVISLAVSVIKNGGIVAYPTDTIYGLGVNIFNEEALRKLYRVKKRSFNKPTGVLICEEAQLCNIAADCCESAKLLMKLFWPGALTIVFPASVKLSRILTGNSETIGVRIPKNRIAVSLIRQSGMPITSPSANITGNSPSLCREEILKELNGEIDMIIDGGKSDSAVPSTVIDLSGKDPVIIRHGRISQTEIERVLSGPFHK